MRFLSFGGSAALHAGAFGVNLWTGAQGLVTEPPRAPVAPSTPVAFDIHRDDPAPVAYEVPSLAASLLTAEAELVLEAETVVEESEIAALPPPEERPAPAFDRPSRVRDLLPEPAPEAVAEEAAFEVYNPPPAYPASARRRGQEGNALLELRILKDGSVPDPVVVECVGSPLFADSALKAVGSWLYQPATLGGVPVERVHRVRFTFKIQT